MRSIILTSLALGCTAGPEPKPAPTDTAAPVVADTGCSEQSWFSDRDGDGFGDPETAVTACEGEPGQVDDNTDCDDADPSVHPGAPEPDCTDPVDRDCDGIAARVDGDGDGAAACEDCDDDDPTRSPDAEEVCNDLDDNCDGEVDEGLDETWYADADGDGFGDPTLAITDCDPGSGWVLDSTDCDDTTAARRPDAVRDYCDGLDNDCDGAIDEDVKAGWILISVDSNARQIVEIDPATGATSRLAPITGSYSGSLNSMDVRANDGLSMVHDSAGYLHGLDACTGQLSLVGATRTGDMGGISFAGTGSLYGISQASDQLMILDPTTGLATPIGPLGFDLGACGIAYDCATDTLYGADTSGQIFQVDTATGLLHSFVMSRVPFSGVGLEFDPSTRRLLAGTGSGNTLWSVDPSTGTSIQIGRLGTTNANDLAFHPACP